MGNGLRPARVAPPGRILKRELSARGWTQKDLAAIIGRPPQAISEIAQGKKQITSETALQFASAFDTSPEFWLNLESNYQLYLSRRKREQGERTDEIIRRRRLYDLLPISEMIKRSWLKAAQPVDDLERQVCQLLGIASIDETPKLAASFRYPQQKSPNIPAQIAWLKRVEQIVETQTVSSFDMDNLRASILNVLALAERAEDVAYVGDRLSSLGIHFVIVPHLSKTYLDGAAFYHRGQPVVVLTLRYNRIDSFWFTLMHELAHIALGHTGVYLDLLNEGVSVPVEAGNGDSAQTEEEAADRQASKWLIDDWQFSRFVRDTAPYFSQEKIKRFAALQRRHPGIILGRLHRTGDVDYKNLRKLLVKVDDYLHPWIDGQR